MNNRNRKGCRIVSMRQPLIWCGERDLNPHEIAPASTSTYSLRPGQPDFNDLGAKAESHDVPWYSLMGTKPSHRPGRRRFRVSLIVVGYIEVNRDFRCHLQDEQKP